MKFGSESCSVFALQFFTAYLRTTVNDDKHDKISVFPAISYQFLYNIPFFISNQFSARWSTRCCGRINNIETLIFLWLKFFYFLYIPAVYKINTLIQHYWLVTTVKLLQNKIIYWCWYIISTGWNRCRFESSVVEHINDHNS